MLDDWIMPHNLHHQRPNRFGDEDPQLSRLQALPYAHHSPLIDLLPHHIPGIYSITGGRQIGKSTLLKQWMLSLMKQGIAAKAIVYYSGELIDDHHHLAKIFRDHASQACASLQYLIIDEITYIPAWDRAVKYAADAGWLERTHLLLTGSDTMLVNQARQRFPGRRGHADLHDFHLYPLSFKQYMHLTAPQASSPSPELFQEKFNHCLIHGGYLKAINDIAELNQIRPSTLETYVDWVRGDMLKHGKQENFLVEILAGILKRGTAQISWNTLSRDLSIDHPKTIAEYIHILEQLDVLFVQKAILEDKRVGAPKKAKRLVWRDPFIYWSIRTLMEGPVDLSVNNPQLAGFLAETVAINHICRLHPTYHIKAEGDVGIATIQGHGFVPIEIKWTEQLRSKTLKQLKKYPNAEIWHKHPQPTMLHNIPARHLPQALFALPDTYTRIQSY